MTELIDGVIPSDLRRFKPYPKYMDSGVEWLGEIPEHWEVRRLKTMASVRLSNVDKKSAEGQETVALCNYVDVYYHERITANIEFMMATATPEQVRRFSLRKGDVLITKDSESWTDIAVPAVVAEDLPDVLCGYHLALIRPNATTSDGGFLARAFSAVGPRDQFQVSASGITRFGLGGDAIRTGLFATPPIDEQLAIAAFLDRETGKINAMVADSERLIELLHEKRTALITHTVTRGLDPSAPMKHSGIEWLGEIPAHWQVMPLGYVLDRIMDFRGRTPHKIGMEWGGDIPAISAVNVRDGYLDFERGVNYGSNALHERWMTSGPTQAGDIVFTTEAPLGNAALISDDSKYILSQRVVLFRPNPRRVGSEFLLQLLQSTTFRQGVEGQATGSTAEGIKRGHLMATPVWLPPIEEQSKILGFVASELTRLERLPDLVLDACNRLSELRSALISAAVTGKIDVRDAQTGGTLP